MNYNYHTHTFFCHHASGTMEEYVERALENGIEYMGFSEHFPIRFPDGFEKPWRVQMNEVSLYTDEVKRIRDKYCGKIEISLGFETEYYPDFFDTMIENARSFGTEYLILGQHFVNSETDYPTNRHSVVKTDSVDALMAYANGVSEAIRRGVYTYVAHPDIFNFTGDGEIYDREMLKICEASKECDVPLELNFLGIREKRNYPCDRFWRLAHKLASPVTFGFDAHRAIDAFDGSSLNAAKKMVEEYGLNYVGKPKLVPIK